MEMAAEKGPVDATGPLVLVEGWGDGSLVRRLTRLAEDAPRREGALTEDWVWEPAISLSRNQPKNSREKEREGRTAESRRATRNSLVQS